MPQYVIYARKSTESEDRQVLSIDSQIQSMRELALRHGVQVADVLTEMRSAKAPGRPVFGDLMRRVRRGQINGILCWKMDRLARNPYDAGLVLQAQLDGQLERIITSDGVKTSDGNDRLLGTFEFALATKFIDDLKANVRRGNIARYQRGWPNFRPPAGYLEDPIAKTIVPDPRRFDLIRRSWDLLLTGTIRPSQILRTLNLEWGYRSRQTKRRGGGPMSLSGLYGVFANPFYKGLFLIGTETWKGAFQPMVSEEEFARGQEILGRAARPRPVHHEFAFAGMLHCATCGRALVAEAHIKASGKRYVYYRCHRRRADEVCHEPAVPESVLREQLAADLSRMSLSKEAAAWVAEQLKASLAGEITQLHTAKESVEQAIAQASREEDALLTLRLRGSIDDATFERRKAVIQDRRVHLQLRLDQPKQSPDDLLSRLDQVLAFAIEAPKVFRTGTAVQQRQILESVGSNFRVTGRKVLYEAKKPFSLLEGRSACSLWWALAEDLRTWLLGDEGFWLPDPQAHLGADLMRVANDVT